VYVYVCVCVLIPKVYKRRKRESLLVNNLPPSFGIDMASRRLQRTYWLIFLGLDQLSFDFIAPLREFLWGVEEVPTRGGFFARTIVPAARERMRGKFTPTPTMARGRSWDTPVATGWIYSKRHVQGSPKSKELHATVHTGGVGRRGVAQLLSVVKPVNRGVQTPLRTAARSYTFDVSLPPSRYPVASNLPLAQFIARRTWSNSFLAISSRLNIDIDAYRIEWW